jgi:hypothetical protein
VTKKAPKRHKAIYIAILRGSSHFAWFEGLVAVSSLLRGAVRLDVTTKL